MVDVKSTTRSDGLITNLVTEIPTSELHIYLEKKRELEWLSRRESDLLGKL